MTAPDLTTEIIGYRQWYVTSDLELRPAHKTANKWKPGVNTATCERVIQTKHGDFKPKPCKDTPGSDCECGLYALHDPSDLWYGRKDKNLWSSLMVTWGGGADPLVSGIVVAWGKVEVHHEGFRAERARVVALALPEGKRNAAVVRAAASEYGVPCVPIDDLPRIAAEFGVTVPAGMRPPKPEPKEDSLTLAMLGNSGGFWGSGGSLVSGSGYARSSHLWTPGSAYLTVDPGSLFTYAVGGPASTPVAPPPQTRNPITKREPANRQGPRAGRKRPPKNLGNGGR
jgi:hypothetical protein